MAGPESVPRRRKFIISLRNNFGRSSVAPKLLSRKRIFESAMGDLSCAYFFFYVLFFRLRFCESNHLLFTILSFRESFFFVLCGRNGRRVGLRISDFIIFNELSNKKNCTYKYF